MAQVVRAALDRALTIFVDQQKVPCGRVVAATVNDASEATGDSAPLGRGWFA